MAFTTGPTAEVRDSDRPGLLNTAELIQIRKLYLENRYKQCITTCDKNLEQALHPIHTTFLLFQQAISYEALGIAAHNYSRNKIPFLESAAEHFRKSLEALPQPFAADEKGEYPTPNSHPLVTTDVCKPFSEGQLVFDTPNPVINWPADSDFSDSSSDYSSQSSPTNTIGYSAPDFDKYSPRPDTRPVRSSIPRTITFADVFKQDPSTGSDLDDETDLNLDGIPKGQTPKALSRLSATLSSTHVLAGGLVPSPLFSRAKKKAIVPFPAFNVSEEELSDPKPRLLTSAPYANGIDHTLVPIRKTAVQTLISKFENTLPSPTMIPSPHTPNSIYSDASVPPSTATNPAQNLTTPITARLDLIHSIFTPNPIIHSHLESYLSSRSLARYNAALASFRTSVLTAISTTTDAIANARGIQENHAEEKRRTFLASSHDAGKRMASYWLLSTPTPTPAPQPAKTMSRGDAAIDSSAVSIDFRLKTWRGKGTAKCRHTVDDDMARGKKERIERLRADGFRVRKENFGWKGMEHYEELRHSAETDLIVGA